MLSFNRRKKRVKSKIVKSNKGNRPIVVVFRSNKNIYVQLISIDGNVITSYSSNNMVGDEKKTGMEKAKYVGKEFAKLCKKQGIDKVVFSKGAYNYNGRVKSVAEACREEGLIF